MTARERAEETARIMAMCGDPECERCVELLKLDYQSHGRDAAERMREMAAAGVEHLVDGDLAASIIRALCLEEGT